MSITVTVDLNPKGAAGTRATVVKKRLFRPPLTEEFVCTGDSITGGGSWISTATGKPPNADLLALINPAAQKETEYHAASRNN